MRIILEKNDLLNVFKNKNLFETNTSMFNLRTDLHYQADEIYLIDENEKIIKIFKDRYNRLKLQYNFRIDPKIGNTIKWNDGTMEKDFEAKILKDNFDNTYLVEGLDNDGNLETFRLQLGYIITENDNHFL